MKIDCDEKFHSVSVVCESHATDYVAPHGEHVNQTVYGSIKNMEKNNSTLAFC